MIQLNARSTYPYFSILCDILLITIMSVSDTVAGRIRNSFRTLEIKLSNAIILVFLHLANLTGSWAICFNFHFYIVSFSKYLIPTIAVDGFAHRRLL